MHKQGRYHHGHLRQALLDAGLQLATERGINGFTLREVARQAGVSPAAPYHHFPHKAALVEALAVQSFEALATALRGAAMTASGTALEQLQAIGVAYVRFAVEHAGAFHFIFRPELHASSRFESQEGAPGPSPIDQASHDARQVLLDAIVACQQEGWIAPGDPAPLALTAWCTVHGLATILLHGSLSRQRQEIGAVEHAGQLAEIVTRTLIGGLLAREGRSETRVP